MSDPRKEYSIEDSPLMRPLYHQRSDAAVNSSSSNKTVRSATRILPRPATEKAAVLQNLTTSFDTTLQNYANVNTANRSLNRQSLGFNQSIISSDTSFTATPAATPATSTRATSTPAVQQHVGATPPHQSSLQPTQWEMLNQHMLQQNEMMRAMQRRMEQFELQMQLSHTQSSPVQGTPVPRLPEPFAERGENIARLARYNGPTPFDCVNARRDFRVLRNFVSEMELWFNTTGVSTASPDSFTMARMKLKGDAQVWVNNMLKSGQSIGTWVRLKELLENRYQPVNLDGYHLDRLVELRCHDGDIMSFNDGFRTHVDASSIGHNFRYLFELYRRGLEKSRNTRWLVTQLNQAEDDGKFSDMNEVYNYAEKCQRLFSRGPPTERMNSSRYPMLTNGATRTASEGGEERSEKSTALTFYTPNNRQPAGFNERSGQFYTPNNHQSAGFKPRLNNVEAEMELQSDLPEELADEEEVGDDQRHDDVTVGSDANDGVYLNAMKFFDTSRKFNPSGTPEQVEKDRVNNACFVCHKAGHQARNCSERPKQQVAPPKKW
jgi:hypothetical protein